MLVTVNTQRGSVLSAEQGHEFRVLLDIFRFARAAQMTIQAEDSISRSHYHVQIVGNQQHPAMVFLANVIDQAIQCGLSTYVDP